MTDPIIPANKIVDNRDFFGFLESITLLCVGSGNSNVQITLIVKKSLSRLWSRVVIQL